MNTKGGALWVSQKRGQLGEGSKENLKRRNGRQAISDTNGSERKLGPTNVHRIQIIESNMFRSILTIIRECNEVHGKVTEVC